jgi:hypothetical protein
MLDDAAGLDDEEQRVRWDGELIAPPLSGGPVISLAVTVEAVRAYTRA